MHEQHRYFQASVNQGLINDLPPGEGTRENPAPPVNPEDIRESYTNGEGETELYYTNRFGSRTEIEDPLGRITEMERDDFNQMTQITFPRDNKISYEYDKKGNLTKITDHGIDPPAVTLIQYDEKWNRPKRIEDPEHHVTVLAYDPDNGNLLSITDPKTYKTTFTYLTQVYDADSDLSFDYDDADRLISYSSAAVAGQPPLTLGYTYHADGVLDTMADPTGTTVYLHNANDWLTRITDPQSRLTGFGYDKVGRRTGMSHHNATAVAYTFDDAGRLTDMVHDLWGTPFLSLAYAHDAVGNILTMTDEAGGHTYGYDTVYQLKSAEHPNPQVNPNERFTYDPVGNRLTSHLSGDYRYDDANQLVEDDDFTYAYDANGNLEKKTAKAGGAETTYTYDAEDRLIRVDLPGNSWAEYRYDALGRRIEKSVDVAITRYTYDGEDILFEYDGGNNVVARYTHGPGIDEPLIMERSGQAYYYHADHLGSIRALTDGVGAVVRTYTYDSFGRIVAQTGNVLNPYSYTARQFDPEIGLHYYRMRTYDPLNGRFLQKDLIRADSNPYPYVLNNPLGWIDPYGLQWDEPLLDRIVGWLPKILEKTGRKAIEYGVEHGSAGAVVVGGAMVGVAKSLEAIEIARRAAPVVIKYYQGSLRDHAGCLDYLPDQRAGQEAAKKGRFAFLKWLFTPAPDYDEWYREYQKRGRQRR